jgi:NADPH:quinone reductase-like Zn-dependent oxidoreductase/NADP-dependent 3-hydroxy acid dehydrogenase YdfG
MMDPAVAAFRDIVAATPRRAPKRPFVSNLTGAFITAEEATDPEYWTQHMRRAVRFMDGMGTARSIGNPLFVELGPRTLTHLMAQLGLAENATAVLDGPKMIADEAIALHDSFGWLWSRGGIVDWRKFSATPAHRTQILPTYPFQRQRHWIGHAVHDLAGANRLSLYDVEWRPAPLGEIRGNRSDGSWLIFMDDVGLGEALAKRLESGGAQVLRIFSGPAFVSRPGFVSVRPGEKSDFEALLALPELATDAPVHVVHLWSVTGEAGAHNTVEAFDDTALTGFHTLLTLVQAASEDGIADRLRIVAAADAIVTLEGDLSAAHAEKALLLGPCRVLPQEIAGLAMRALDIPPFVGAPPAFLVDAILDEAMAEDGAPLAALRPHGRYVEALVQLPRLSVGRPRLRDKGTVLITGGLGSLGLEVARDLFAAARAHLVLVSRSKVPSREEWETRAEAGDPLAEVLQKLLALEADGAELLVLAADVGDRDAMADVLASALERFGTIHAVVHAAGVIADEAALAKTRETADRVLRGKTRGAFVLEELLATTPLDFFVYFSSITGQLPGRGRIDYASANAVIDTLARRQTASPHALRTSLAWDAWREIGMAVRWADRDVKRTAATAGTSEAVGHPLVQSKRRAADGSTIYGSFLVPERHWVLDEHRFNKRAILPATGMLESIRAAFTDLSRATASVELSEIVYRQPFFVDPQGKQMEIAFFPNGGTHRFELSSLSASGERMIHATGYAAECGPATDAPRPPEPVRTPYDRSSTAKGRFEWGDRWRCTKFIDREGDRTRISLRLAPEFVSDLAIYTLHPSLLDMGFFQHADRFDAVDSAPFALESIRIHRPFPPELNVEGIRRSAAGGNIYDYEFRDGEGCLLVEARGYQRRELGAGGLERASENRRAPSRLVVGQPGDFASLRLDPAPLRPPGPDEIQIEVVAAGLNFRDVLSALGQLPGADGGVGELGSELAGIVTALGEGVGKFRVGDSVVAFAPHSFATHVITDARLAAPLPRGTSFEDAAGLPIAFLTAEYGLDHLARLECGERVLIHSATGGVGLAAVQIARNRGAEILATAGSPEKREYLRKLGIAHVFDSRSVAFADEVLAATGGEGVDVVLNALAGDFIRRGLDVLRPFGRFVEIGKRDIFADSPMGLAPFRKNLGYFAFDLGLLRQQRPGLAETMLRSLVERIESGALRPLPTQVVPVEEVSRGFELLARARHIGKIVFGFRASAQQSREARTSEERFNTLYGDGIAVKDGLAMFRHLLSSDETPSYAIVTPRVLAQDLASPKPADIASSRARQTLATPYAPPTNKDEAVLVQLWQDMLGVDAVGIDDDFVALGGNSITALQILYGVHRHFGLRLPATAIFRNPTVARLTLAIREAKAPLPEKVEPAPAKDESVERLARELAALDAETAARLLRETAAE